MTLVRGGGGIIEPVDNGFVVIGVKRRREGEEEGVECTESTTQFAEMATQNGSNDNNDNNEITTGHDDGDSWGTGLPSDLLFVLFAEYIGARSGCDRYRDSWRTFMAARGVCRTWRSAAQCVKRVVHAPRLIKAQRYYSRHMEHCLPIDDAVARRAFCDALATIDADQMTASIESYRRTRRSACDKVLTGTMVRNEVVERSSRTVRAKLAQLSATEQVLRTSLEKSARVRACLQLGYMHVAYDENLLRGPLQTMDACSLDHVAPENKLWRKAINSKCDNDEDEDEDDKDYDSDDDDDDDDDYEHEYGCSAMACVNRCENRAEINMSKDVVADCIEWAIMRRVDSSSSNTTTATADETHISAAQMSIRRLAQRTAARRDAIDRLRLVIGDARHASRRAVKYALIIASGCRSYTGMNGTLESALRVHHVVREWPDQARALTQDNVMRIIELGGCRDYKACLSLLHTRGRETNITLLRVLRMAIQTRMLAVAARLFYEYDVAPSQAMREDFQMAGDAGNTEPVAYELIPTAAQVKKAGGMRAAYDRFGYVRRIRNFFVRRGVVNGFP